MKEKKNIFMMLYSIALFVLIFAVVPVLVQFFIIKLPFLHMYGSTGIIIIILQLLTSILAIAFSVVFILDLFIKTRKWLEIAQYVSIAVVLLFFVVAALVLFIIFVLDEYRSSTNYYVELFDFLLKVIISEVIIFISSFCLNRINKKGQKEEQKALEQQSTEQQEETI